MNFSTVPMFCVSVNGIDDLFLLIRLYTDALKCLPCSTVGADKGFIVRARECRRCSIGLSAPWAFSYVKNICRFHSLTSLWLMP